MNTSADVLIIGAGAAGMMCAIEAARRGRSVLLLEHSAKLAEKIRISGGGRCNLPICTPSQKTIYPTTRTSAAPRWHAIRPNILLHG